jgi:aspartyl-tRNA(Asn)/glutamyl-tRNA(Gln) amidotransferase subunit C
MISKEEVLKIASLSRLELSETEIAKMQKDLSSILDYFNLLKKAPKPAKSEKVIAENILRKDEPRQAGDSLAAKIIEAAPDTKDGYIKVKQVLS